MKREPSLSNREEEEGVEGELVPPLRSRRRKEEEEEEEEEEGGGDYFGKFQNFRFILKNFLRTFSTFSLIKLMTLKDSLGI